MRSRALVAASAVLAGSLVAASLLGLATAAAASVPAPTPREVIERTARQVLAVLDDPSLDHDARIHRIERIADARFDFRTVARLVLARHWRQLTAEQRDEFVREFKRHLSVTYGRNLDLYSHQSVEILGDREEARGDWSVQTRIVGGDPPDEILVDYRLRRIGGEWKIIDVVVEHVSLIANFRSQLAELISRRGVEGTLALLREKNASGESILPEEERSLAERGRAQR